MELLMGIVCVIGIMIFILQNDKDLKAENARLYAQIKKLVEERNSLKSELETLKAIGVVQSQEQQIVAGEQQVVEIEKQQVVEKGTPQAVNEKVKTSKANPNFNSGNRQAEAVARYKALQQKRIEQYGQAATPEHQAAYEKAKLQKSKQQTKNNFILMTGASLIVLAAIVFLTSMWGIMPDIFKIGVLLLLMVVFLGMSKIAYRNFNLPNTANTFFYIAMAYIPVLALAIFLISGNSGYLRTIQQERLFWLIAWLVMSAIYGWISVAANRKPLFVGSLITQILSVIFGTLLFTESFENVLLAMVVYNLILTIIDAYAKPKLFGSLVSTFNEGILWIFGVITGFTILGGLFAGLEVATIFTVMTLTLIVFIYARQRESIAYINLFVVGMFMTMFVAVNTELFGLQYEAKQVIMILTTIVIFGIGMLSNWDKLKDVIKVLTHIFLGILFVSTWSGASIYSFIVPCVSLAIFIAMMKIDYKYENIYLHFALISFIVAIFSVFMEFNKNEYIVYINLFATIVLYGVSLITKELTSKTIKAYSNILAIVSMLTLSADITLVKFIVNIGTAIYFCSNTKKKDLSEYLNIIPLSLLISNIYLSDLTQILGTSLIHVISMVMIISLALLSLKDRKFNVYTTLTYLYLFMQIICFDINKYIDIAILMLISLLQVLCYNNGSKNFAKTVLYISMLSLHNEVMRDLNVELTTILSLGYMVILGLISRDVLYKIDPALSKLAQYLGYFAIFGGVSITYINEFDAMLFMGLLLGLIIFAYRFKFGPLFLCSVLAELGMGYRVTQEFWASIPWWIYLLTAGAVLIFFAMTNEAKEKKEENKLSNKLKQISKDLDM